MGGKVLGPSRGRLSIMSDEGRHPAGGVPSVTGWDGESAAKRSRHVDAGEPHQEGDEFVGETCHF